MPLDVGDPAPSVSAPNQHGEPVAPSFEAPTVLYFYPEDGTPGCTVEANQFGLEAETYAEAGVAVYGVSMDDVASHAAFADAEGIEFDLLSDPDGEIADAFGVDTSGGRADRTTFVIDDGAIAAVYTGVNPDGHARDVLMDLLDEGLVDLEW